MNKEFKIVKGRVKSARISELLRKSSKIRGDYLLFASAMLIPAVFLIYPLWKILQRSFYGENGQINLDSWQELLENPNFVRVVWTTIWVSSLSTFICVVLGVFIAIVVVYAPFPGAKIISRIIDIYVSFPSFLIALALLFMWGRYGLVNGLVTSLAGDSVGPILISQNKWGVVLAEVTYFTPFVMRPVISALETVNPAVLEIAAALGASPLRVIRTVLIPEIAPAILAGAAITLVCTFNEFGIVLFIGTKEVVTLPVLIYSQAITFGNYEKAATASIISILISSILYALYRAGAGKLLRGRRVD